MNAIWWLIAIGGLIMLFALWRSSEERSRRATTQKVDLLRRLQSFEHAERIRQSATAKRAAHGLNADTYRAYKAMVKAAIEADQRASASQGSKRRCE